ncbi:uncharacterized protein LOC105934633 [Fundulus heteroclitus]|uniref:uncharacterized protein LOC105934633 n=1 Tax=Fundulus heteroclitus TaxID=8078 RepID=UPI00165AC199|nr:uncharacterized protein LOC105934633 [Fundulus heteroclitus]
MSHSKSSVGVRQTVLLPISNRTLQQPSFLPHYAPAGFHPHFHGYPMTPADLRYTSPTLPCGRRVYNGLGGKMVFNCCQLNTPLPVMSACVAPPNRPDPFRAGPYPTYSLGSTSWTMQSLPPAQEQPRLIVQLTQQEDQAITNLLELHHQEAPRAEGTITGFPNVICNEAPEESRRWSEAGCGAAEQVDGRLRGKTAAPPDLLLKTSGTEPECPTLSPLESCDRSQTGSCMKENGAFWDEDMTATLEPDQCVDSEAGSGSAGRMLTDLEGDAVLALLSLGGVRTLLQ